MRAILVCQRDTVRNRLTQQGNAVRNENLGYHRRRIDHGISQRNSLVSIGAVVNESQHRRLRLCASHGPRGLCCTNVQETPHHKGEPGGYQRGDDCTEQENFPPRTTREGAGNLPTRIRSGLRQEEQQA